jgi:coenzyme F420-reducing hydrogenase delta subunit
VLAAGCAGALHTSVVEVLIRSGVGGVLVAACPPRDCWHREGPKWLGERLYRGREAELQERVQRARVRVVYAGEAEAGAVRRALAGLRADLRGLARARGEGEVEIATECEPQPVELAS